MSEPFIINSLAPSLASDLSSLTDTARSLLGRGAAAPAPSTGNTQATLQGAGATQGSFTVNLGLQVPQQLQQQYAAPAKAEPGPIYAQRVQMVSLPSEHIKWYTWFVLSFVIVLLIAMMVIVIVRMRPQ